MSLDIAAFHVLHALGRLDLFILGFKGEDDAVEVGSALHGCLEFLGDLVLGAFDSIEEDRVELCVLRLVFADL
jgi:hypothetical protein